MDWFPGFYMIGTSVMRELIIIDNKNQTRTAQLVCYMCEIVI